MTFTTLTYLLFLPLVWGLYWALPGQRARNALLVAASYVFYGWWDARFAVLMLAASLVDFASALLVERSATRRARRAWLLASLTFSLGLLGFFKYFNFFSQSAARAAAAVGWELGHVTLDVVLPVGISFYTFQTMSYVIDVYRGRLPATRGLLEYLAYVAFFPQLVAGPIERATALLPQFQTLRRFEVALAADGCRLLLWGFFKKMALADNLAGVVDAAYNNPQASGPSLLAATLAFAFQIYCDFSAYSEIAAGSAALFGVRLMRNFALPYFAHSVAEFWRRWHISLSTWFADYVYVSLGGNRVARWRIASNALATFALSGLWHGANWTYLTWGLLNGVAVLPSILGPAHAKIRASDVPGGERRWPAPLALARMLSTFGFVCLGWVFFRSPSLGAAGQTLATMAAGPWSLAALGAPFVAAPGPFAGIALLLAVEWASRRHRHPLQLEAWPRAVRWLLYTVLAWTTLALAPATPSPFIYFQF